MALFPCEIHLSRYQGPSSAAYPALLVNGTSSRKRLRVCEPCLIAKVDETPVPLQQIMDDGSNMAAFSGEHVCASGCKDPTFAAFFLAAYKRGQEGETYYAAVCERCSLLLAEHWGLEL